MSNQVINQKVHHVVEPDRVNVGCYAVVLEMVDKIYGEKKPFRYPLMVGIVERNEAQRIARKLSQAWADCLNILKDTEGLTSCAQCGELVIPSKVEYVNGKSYCPDCGEDAKLRINLEQIKQTMLRRGLETAEVDKRLAIISG